MSDSHQIAKNTLMLYFRQILIMLVSLYTVRVVLNVLGAEDYGIYNVVAGVVTMFGFLNGAMATASQRYFSYDLGKGDFEQLKTTFSVTFQIYVLLALVVVLFAETIGLWFVNHKLVISTERMVAANWIYQAAVFSFLLTLVTTPYMASIIAHENMNVYAYVSIVEAGLKLGIVFLLKLLTYDKLIIYSLLLAFVAFINTSIYRMYCHKNYTECKLRFIRNPKIAKNMLSYISWNLFGTISIIVKNQGLTILINQMFSPVVVAARSLSIQIASVADSFAQNFSTAVRPQIIKSYAQKNISDTQQVIVFASKMVFYLMLIICLPLIFSLDFILCIWLTSVPDYLSLFTRLLLIENLINVPSYPLMAGVQATGKIGHYQFWVGIILSLTLPASYIALRFKLAPEIVYIINIVFRLLCYFPRNYYFQKLLGINYRILLMKIVAPIIFVSMISSIGSFFIYRLLYGTPPKNVLMTFMILIYGFIIVFLFGINQQQRVYIFTYVKRLLWNRGKIK